MSEQQRNTAPLWVKLVTAALALAVLLAVAATMGNLLLAGTRLLHSDGGSTVADPQFREDAELVTRPPELTEGEPAGAGREDLDPSADWEVEEEGPVTQTAQELAQEAAEAAAAPAREDASTDTP